MSDRREEFLMAQLCALISNCHGVNQSIADFLPFTDRLIAELTTEPESDEEIAARLFAGLRTLNN